MKKLPPVALIGAGNFADSPFTRMHNLGTLLGPVKAPSLRVASRIANRLRAGHPVTDYKEFERCELVLISVPDEMLSSIVGELLESIFDWQDKAVVAYSDLVGCQALADLARRGASTGTLAKVPGYEDRWLLLEGERTVERQLRQVLMEGRLTVIEPLHKQRYVEALAGVPNAFLPCLKHASEGLKSAGIPFAEVTEMVERQVLRTMRSYFRSGRAG